jgi:hypothetical protein
MERAGGCRRLGERGSARSKVALGIALVVVCVFGGYLLGRDVVGEHYLKPGASAAPAGALGKPSGAPGDSAKGAELLGSDPFIYLERKEGQRKAAGGSGAPRTNVSEAPKPRGYTVQVGVFLDEKNSRLLQEELNNKGYSARLKDVKQQGKTVHRVQAGSFASEQEAQRMTQELQQQGYRVIVVPEE